VLAVLAVLLVLALLMVLFVLSMLFVLVVLILLMSPSLEHWGSLCRVQGRDPFVSRTCKPPGPRGSCARVEVRVRVRCGGAGLVRYGVVGRGESECRVLHARFASFGRVQWFGSGSRACVPPGPRGSCARVEVRVRMRRGGAGLARCGVTGRGECEWCVLRARFAPCGRGQWNVGGGVAALVAAGPESGRGGPWMSPAGPAPRPSGS